MSKKAIKKALANKGWEVADILYEPVSYGRDGRDGGWIIQINEENCSDNVYDKLQSLVDVVFKDGCFTGSQIWAYNSSSALEIIKSIPQFESITENEKNQ